MTDQSPDPPYPPVVDRESWQQARDALFAREKAHLRRQRRSAVWRTNGRPIAQWRRIEAGRSDELSEPSRG